MTEKNQGSDESRAALLSGFQAKVAVVGPKGSGKSVYRLYTSQRAFDPPAFLQRALKVRSEELKLARIEELVPGESGESWSWREQRIPQVLIKNSLYQLPGTNHITRQRLQLPRSLGGRPGPDNYIVDFPGEYWSNYGRQRTDSYTDATQRQDRELLAGCRVILLTIPFWLLIPREMRPKPQLMNHNQFRLIARIRKLAQDPVLRKLRAQLAAASRPERTMLVHGINEHFDQMLPQVKLSADEERTALQQAMGAFEDRDAALRESAQEWLNVLNALLSALKEQRRERPMLLVALTMLSQDWHCELESLPQAPFTESHLSEVWDLLKGIRGTLQAPALNLDLGPAPGGLIARAVEHYRRAAQLRRGLVQLDQQVSRYIELLWRYAEQSSDSELKRIAKKTRELVELGDTQVRYMAMNVISERKVRMEREQPSRPPTLPFMEVDPAGVHLPSVYLCGKLGGLL